jgi:DNA modification methylase
MKKRSKNTKLSKPKSARTEKLRLAPAKGRPFLFWVGKQPIEHARGFPAQLVETVRLDSKLPPIREFKFQNLKNVWRNLVFHGDNKEVMGFLLANGFRGTIDFIYIDPPFDSNADYIRRVELRGLKEKSKVEGEDYSLGEQIQYTDIWANDKYLQFMYERFILLKELLSENGFIVVHMNAARSHYIKVIMDEIFGNENFRNEIIVKRIRKSYSEQGGVQSLNEGCDYLLLYSKSPATRLKPPMKYDPKVERWHSYDAPGVRQNLTYKLFTKLPPPGRHWMKTEEESKKMIESGKLRPNPSTGWPEYKLAATDYISRDTLWDDITGSAFTTGYPTEKKEEMIDLLLDLATLRGSLVLDCFVGSGTTLASAQRRGLHWIGVDINKGAIQTTSRRIQNIIMEQLKDISKNGRQKKLQEMESTTPTFAFDVLKVNDYDLQLLRTEAMELAVQHVGIQRTRTDSFFDGTFGKNLVKIIDFNHPLTKLDLQLVQDELKKRPDENRNVSIVCLGKESGVDPLIEDYNKKHPVNKFEVIELRTDSKYGRFLVHNQPSAKVDMKRKNEKAVIVIKDFISPTIVERINDPNSLFKVKITDFRSMIDVVLVDTNYDGNVFNIVYSDCPQEKKEMVSGTYELDISRGSTTVAVKIIDMLGEELIMTKKL